jgi:hypothetical protein
MLKTLLYLSIATTVGIALLVGSNVYHNTTTSQTEQISTIQNIPIVPVFDMDTVNELTKRRKITIDMEKRAVQTPTISPAVDNGLTKNTQSTRSAETN